MRVAVYGGDVVGLVVANVLRRRGHNAIVIEKDKPGASAASMRFLYLDRTKDVRGLLESLGLVYGEYSISCGVLLSGEVVSCERNLSPSVQHAYWSKTRFTTPTTTVSITDPEAGTGRQAITVDMRDVVDKLVALVPIKREATGAFDMIIETRPLWESPFVNINDPFAVQLGMAPVSVIRDRFLKWDVVYTPFTPGNSVHRVYHHLGGYVCEFSGTTTEDRLISDLNFLFPDGWSPAGKIEKSHGHLMPLVEKPVWQRGVVPIGRLAAWDERSTIGRVIRDAKRAVDGKR